MENKTPLLTKLILIFEPALLAAILISFYFLRESSFFAGIVSWLWSALIIFSFLSFLFFLVVFIIALIKNSLRTAYWPPFLLVSCIAFLVIVLIMFTAPTVMQPQFIDYTSGDVVYAEEEVRETESAQEKQEETQKLETYEIGDTIEVGDLVVKVNNIRTVEKDESGMLEEGYIYLLVDISIENKGDQEAYLETFSNLRLVDKNGRNYESVWAEDAKGQIEGNLGAGRKIAGELSYGIPIDVKDFELEVSDPNSWGAGGIDMVIINLQLEE